MSKEYYVDLFDGTEDKSQPYLFCHKCGAKYLKIYIECRMKDPFYNATEEHYTKCYFCGNDLDEERFTIDDEFDEQLVEKRKKKEKLMDEYDSKKHEQFLRNKGITPIKPQTTPTCPTCHSTNVSKISGAKKAAGFLTVGVFSSNFGKTMECKNCGYKW